MPAGKAITKYTKTPWISNGNWTKATVASVSATPENIAIIVNGLLTFISIESLDGPNLHNAEAQQHAEGPPAGRLRSVAEQVSAAAHCWAARAQQIRR